MAVPVLGDRLECRALLSVANLTANVSPMVLRQINPMNQPHSVQVAVIRPVTLAGYVTDAWQVTGGYAYTDARITSDTSGTIVKGNRVGLVPFNTFSLWNRYQFNQVWAVPPSSIPLKVSAVLLSSGTVVGGSGGGAGAQTGTIPISSVIGLTSALSVLPIEGVGYAPGLAAVINASGQLAGASGNLGDCVKVDGSSGPCGGGGVLPQII